MLATGILVDPGAKFVPIHHRVLGVPYTSPSVGGTQTRLTPESVSCACFANRFMHTWEGACHSPAQCGVYIAMVKMIANS
jgi:hypothetical protein